MTHYCVTRADIPVGTQAAQLIHAAGESSPGNLSSGTYAIALAVPDENALRALGRTLAEAGVSHRLVIENDAPYADQAMAIGIAPGDRKQLKRFLSKFPLLR